MNFLLKKINDNNTIEDSLSFQKRVCNAVFECFIKTKKEQKKYIEELFDDNINSLNIKKTISEDFKKGLFSNLIINEDIHPKKDLDFYFVKLKNFLLEQTENQQETPTNEIINTTDNKDYDFKLYYDENNNKKYAWKLKNTDVWYDAEPEVVTAIEKKIKFSQNKTTEGELPDKEVAKKVRKIGFDKFFNGLKKALMSSMGSLVQRFLSLTGIGAVATTVLWGAVTLYDAYKLISGSGNWMSLLLDILSLVSNGYLSKYLAPLQNVVSGSIKSAMDTLKKTPKIYNIAQKFIPKLAEKFANVNWLISKGSEWVKKKLNADIDGGQSVLSQAQTELSQIPENNSNTNTTTQTTTESFYITKKQFNKKQNIYKLNYI